MYIALYKFSENRLEGGPKPTNIITYKINTQNNVHIFTIHTQHRITNMRRTMATDSGWVVRMPSKLARPRQKAQTHNGARATQHDALKHETIRERNRALRKRNAPWLRKGAG
jgi:hypothetical protein